MSGPRDYDDDFDDFVDYKVNDHGELRDPTPDDNMPNENWREYTGRSDYDDKMNSTLDESDNYPTGK